MYGGHAICVCTTRGHQITHTQTSNSKIEIFSLCLRLYFIFRRRRVNPCMLDLPSNPTHNHETLPGPGASSKNLTKKTVVATLKRKHPALPACLISSLPLCPSLLHPVCMFDERVSPCMLLLAHPPLDSPKEGN